VWKSNNNFAITHCLSKVRNSPLFCVVLCGILSAGIEIGHHGR
jgi:hypothetical protein